MDVNPGLTVGKNTITYVPAGRLNEFEFAKAPGATEPEINDAVVNPPSMALEEGAEPNVLTRFSLFL